MALVGYGGAGSDRYPLTALATLGSSKTTDFNDTLRLGVVLTYGPMGVDGPVAYESEDLDVHAYVYVDGAIETFQVCVCIVEHLKAHLLIPCDSFRRLKQATTTASATGVRRRLRHRRKPTFQPRQRGLLDRSRGRAVAATCMQDHEQRQRQHPSKIQWAWNVLVFEYQL